MFMYFGCLLLFSAAFFISPLFCGSSYERQMMFKGPQEIEPGYATNMDDEGNVV